jgi:Domain of unknown function (DUF4279)
MKNITLRPIVSDRYKLSTSLRVQGSQGLDFDEVSRILKNAPSSVMKKGTASRIGKVYETDTWVLASPVPEDRPLDRHLRWFMRKCLDVEALKVLRNLEGVEEVDLFCAVSLNSAACRLHLPADVLASLQSMGLDLELSLDFGSAEDDTETVDFQAEEGADLVQAEVKERASAALRGLPEASLQTSVLEALSLFPNEDQATLSSGLEERVEIVLQTVMTEEGSLDSKLQELGEALRGSVGKILTRRGADSLLVESRFETNCEWGSTRLSHRSLDLPISLHCPISIEVALA